MEQNNQKKGEENLNFPDDITIRGQTNLKNTAHQELCHQPLIINRSEQQQVIENSSDSHNKGWDLELKAWRSHLYGQQNLIAF